MNQPKRPEDHTQPGMSEAKAVIMGAGLLLVVQAVPAWCALDSVH